MSNSIYATVTGSVIDHLNRWSNEVESYAKLYAKHPEAAECARQRGEEARIAYFAVSQVRDQLLSDKLI
jgi:hypothetical protein